MSRRKYTLEEKIRMIEELTIGRPIPGYSYGINNCIVDDSVIETLLHESCEKYPFTPYFLT